MCVVVKLNIGIQTFSKLPDKEKDILDVVIEKLGKMSKNEIIDFMHKDQAYVETASGILFSSNMLKVYKYYR